MRVATSGQADFAGELDTFWRANNTPPVFRTLGHWFLIVALLATVGGHWVVLQSVAWTNMLAENLREISVTEAFEKTFDGQHPCRLCTAIKEGKRSEKKSALPLPLKKIEFVSEQPVFIFSPPQLFRVLPECSFTLHDWSSQPPVPPPRQLPG